MSRQKLSQDQPPKPMVPVTPMLDMAFQLLSFFIFTFHPDAQYEVEMDLALPQNVSGQALDQKDVDNRIEPNKLPELDDLNEAPTVTAVTQNDGANNGKISSLTVQDRTGLAKPVANLAELEKLLKEDYPDPAGDFKGVIKVRGDPRLKWYAVLEIMDVCHRVGFTRVGLSAPLED